MTGNTTLNIEHIIHELKESLQEAFGNRLENVLLFGSHARGDADPESDIDILVVLSSSRDFKNDEYRCLSISQRLSLNYDVVISCIVALTDDLQIKRPLFLNIQREGVALEGFTLRNKGDYGAPHVVSQEEAESLLRKARSFIDAISGLLS